MGGPRHISVTTEPPDAKVTVYTGAGTWFRPSRHLPYFHLNVDTRIFPGVPVTVLSLKKTDMRKTELNLTTTVKRLVFWEFLFLGELIGLLIVDPATGAMYTLSPKNVSLVLEKQSANIKTDKDGLMVLLRKDVPAEYASRLVPVPLQ